MTQERTIRFALILGGREILDMLGYETPRVGETLGVDGELYEVKEVQRQYMTLDRNDARQETRTGVTVERVHAGYAVRG